MAPPRSKAELAEHDRSLRAALDSLDADTDSPSSTRLTPDSRESDDEINFGHAARSEAGYELHNLNRSQQEHDERLGWRDLEEEHQRELDRTEEHHGNRSYNKDEEQSVVKKLDRKLVLFMALLYMLSFLDRSNIGNARIAGLEDDLALSSNQYEWLLTAFYITYILFEWMTLMYRIVPPHMYISLCVLSWGIIASLQSLTTSFSALLILRALLGVGEAAFGPGLPFYLSFFYRRDELALRTGLFISAAPLSNCFAGSLAWLITWLGGKGPIAPWRLLFLLEGFPSVLVAIYAWYFVPDSPATIPWLNPKERRIAAKRLQTTRSTNTTINEKHLHSEPEGRRGVNLAEIKAALTDPKCYLTALMFFSCNVAFSSMPVFEPTIIHSMGYSTLTSQALSAPPYLLSFIIVLFTAQASDRYLSRSVPLLLHASLGFAGYLYLSVAGALEFGPVMRYLGLFPACVGFFSSITIIITWTINNQPSAGRQGTGMAILNVIGQMGPLLGTRLYPKSDGPYYAKGMFICACFMFFVGVLSLVLRLVLTRANKRALAEYNGHEDGEEEEEEGIGLVAGGARQKTAGPFLYIL